MKASELRIGNIVNRQMKQISVSGADIKWFEDGSFVGIEPIPLTEEWLVRLGFYKQLNYDEPPYYFTNQPLHITVKRFSGIYIEKNNFKLLGNGLDIKHVHQLQNLYFALTGEELSCQSYPNSS